MEYLIVAVILYFILQTAGNLVYILRGGGTANRPRSSPSHRWRGPSPRRETEGPTDRPRFWGKDIEDATWDEINQEEAL